MTNIIYGTILRMLRENHKNILEIDTNFRRITE